MVNLTRDKDGNTRATLLDLVPGRSDPVYAGWLKEWGVPDLVESLSWILKPAPGFSYNPCAATWRRVTPPPVGALSACGRFDVRPVTRRGRNGGSRAVSVVGEGGEGLLVSRYQPTHFLWCRQRLFMASRASWWVASPACYSLLRWRSWALMTSSALCAWSSRSQGPPRARQVMVFMVVSC